MAPDIIERFKASA